MGLILLLLLAAGFLLWTGVVLILRAAAGPTRDGIGRALAEGRPTEPQQLGFEVASRAIETEDGLQLPSWEFTTGNDGPTVVWVHDWGGSQLGLLPRLPAWGAWCGRLVTMDLRGHGEAPGRCSLGRDELDDVRRLLDRHAGESIVLAGEGLGAVLAINAVAAGFVEPLGIFAVDPFVHGSERFRTALKRAGYHVFPAADLALITLWLRGRSPIDLGWSGAHSAVPVLARCGADEAASLRTLVPAGSRVRIEPLEEDDPDRAAAVEGPWW